MVSLDELNAWVASGDSEIQEFKETTGQRGEACKTLCAMLNHRGGRVVFGVENRGRIVGQGVTDKPLEDVTQEVRQHIEPPVFPNFDRVPVGGGRQVLVVTADAQSLISNM